MAVAMRAGCAVGGLHRCRHIGVKPTTPSSCRLGRARAAAPPEGPAGEDLSDLLQDLERYQQRSAAAGSNSAGAGARPGPAAGLSGGAGSPSAGSDAAPSPFKEALDKLLIADFFFVLVALAWLGAGLGVQGALHSSAVLDAWYGLWPLVFQPAIGVLMLGALVSGGLGWLKSREQQQQQREQQQQGRGGGGGRL